MRSRELWSWLEHYGWPLVILLAAAALRFHDLAGVPPGLTHDEADHGITAWQIASTGLRELYFSIGYGREPLYDYAVAALMSFLGPSILAGRLVSVFASLIMIAAMIAWVKMAFNRPAALMAGAGLAVGFWPVMAGRQALRSILLPALFVLALLVFWRAMRAVLAAREKGTLVGQGWQNFLLFIAAGILLGLTFYTYIPARALWIVFPALLLYWLLTNRRFARTLWWRIGIMLLAAAIVAAPILLYLQANPGAEVRIQQLAAPLLAVQEGEGAALTANALAGLRLFFIEGDPTWRYNIAGRPFLTLLFGVLFLLGLAQAVWWMLSRRDTVGNLLGSASFLSLSWLVVGFLPVLITGPELSMTQAIAVQPLVYLLPAIALASVGNFVAGLAGGRLRTLYTAVIVLLFAGLAVVTYRDYFQTWANDPEVRVQYETTLVTAIDRINAQGDGEVLFSTITPGRYHSTAVAQMTLKNKFVIPRWFDGRGSLLLPRDESATMVVPGFTPLPAGLSAYYQSAELIDAIPMRETDRDRPIRFFAVDRVQMSDDWHEQLAPVEAQFEDAVTLVGYDLSSSEAKAGDPLTLVTHWQARRSLPEAVTFTHILDSDGVPVAQADRLDVPGTSWMTGDQFLQLHEMTLPPELEPGDYQVVVGVYTLPDGNRLVSAGDAGAADLLPIATVTIVP